MSENELIIFDTDIGSDIDDVMCLTYLLAQPHCELVGITTVAGPTQTRAMLADALCQALSDRSVPIHSGSPDGLLLPTPQKACPQAQILSRWPHKAFFPPSEAVEFMRTEVRKRPGEITLLAVGSMTNVGLLFAMDPEIPRLLKRFVMMGGIFQETSPGAREWNAMSDPHSTAIVYRSRPPHHRSVGLDVTRHCMLTEAQFWERFPAELVPITAEAAKVWFRNRDRITFHDPLAAATLFEPDLCRYERGVIDVELTSSHAMGATYWRRDEQGPHEIAVSVDVDRFLDHYFTTLSRLQGIETGDGRSVHAAPAQTN